MTGKILAASFLAATMTAALGVGMAQAQGMKYPAGKQVSMYVGTKAGGTADSTMRLIARHIGKFLPGNPTIVAKNMPGAGSRKLAEYLYTHAAKDGTEFGLLLRPIATDPLFKKRGKTTFDIQKLTWLGSPSPVTDVCGFWHNQPIQSFDMLQTKELVIPGISTESGEAVQANIMRRLTGAKIRVVAGYQSGGAMTLAMERGEAAGRCAISWEAIKSKYRDFITKKQFKPFMQFSLKRHADLPQVPSIMEFVKTDIDRQALQVILAPQSFGFPFAAPAGLSKETTAILRNALKSVLTDAGFLAEAKRRKFDIDFVPGTELLSVLKTVYGYPKAVIDRAKALVANK